MCSVAEVGSLERTLETVTFSSEATCCTWMMLDGRELPQRLAHVLDPCIALAVDDVLDHLAVRRGWFWRCAVALLDDRRSLGRDGDAGAMLASIALALVLLARARALEAHHRLSTCRAGGVARVVGVGARAHSS